MCGFTDRILTISPPGDISKLQVNWSFYSSDDNHSPISPSLLILHGYCVMDFLTPCQVPCNNLGQFLGIYFWLYFTSVLLIKCIESDFYISSELKEFGIITIFNFHIGCMIAQ